MALRINIEDLLLKQRIESDRIEFKRSWNPIKIYQTICAFANDFDNIGGGYILVGVEENNGVAKRPVCGISENEVDKILKSMIGFNNKMIPFYLPHTSVEKVDGKLVLAIWVPSGDTRPYEVRSDVTNDRSPSKSYIRAGSSTIEAKGEPLIELREMANRTPFDDRSNKEISVHELSLVLVQDYLRRVHSRLAETVLKQDFFQTLEQLDLCTGPKEDRRLRNVAAMMFCEDPSKFFPYTQVDIVTFPEGIIKNPNNMIEAPAIKGSVPTMIRATLDYLRTNIIKERIIKQKDRAESTRYFNYPYQALEEAVVNALYHRDYQTREVVEINVQPHEISIMSHSGPDRTISDAAIQEAKHLQARRYRNRRLGDFLKELNLSEGRSTGIPTIQKELRRNGSPQATIETDRDRSYFLIHIPCHPDFIQDELSIEPINPANEPINPANEPINVENQALNGRLNTTMKYRLTKLTEFLRTHPSSPKTELALLLQVSRATITRDLQRLVEANIIRRKGSNKSGSWIVQGSIGQKKPTDRHEP